MLRQRQEELQKAMEDMKNAKVRGGDAQTARANAEEAKKAAKAETEVGKQAKKIAHLEGKLQELQAAYDDMTEKCSR